MVCVCVRASTRASACINISNKFYHAIQELLLENCAEKVHVVVVVVVVIVVVVIVVVVEEEVICFCEFVTLLGE